MTRMTMSVKLRGSAADELLEDVAGRLVNSNMQTGVPAGRPLARVGGGESTEAMSLGELSLGELLYYVLLGDGRIADEPT